MRDLEYKIQRRTKLANFFRVWAKKCLYILLRVRRIFLIDDISEDRASWTDGCEGDRQEEYHEMENFIETILTKTQREALRESIVTCPEDIQILQNSGVSKAKSPVRGKPQAMAHHDLHLRAGFPSLLPIYLFQCRLLLIVTHKKLEILTKTYQALNPKQMNHSSPCHDMMVEAKSNLSDAIRIMQLYSYLTTTISIGESSRENVESELIFVEFRRSVYRDEIHNEK